MARLFRLAVLLVTLLLAGCGEAGYYWQAASGQLQILSRRRPISQVIVDPATPATLKERLELVLRLRDFASAELGLPENDSYRCYADLGREAVVWNVVAAPEFSLQARTWCFPFAGCVAYRGYFARADAEAFAASLRAAGDDVLVYGVVAYSTLGWFDDPVLNTFIERPEPALAGMLFHELSHQRLYLKGDSPFNEGFAQVLEEAGVERWLQGHAPGKLDAWREQRRREREFLALLRSTREQLAILYAGNLPDAEKRAEKQRLFAALRLRYQEQRQAWGGYAGYDRWFEQDLNNARLLSVGTYHDLAPAFRALLRREGGDVPAFLRAVEALAALDPGARAARLRELETAVVAPAAGG